MIKKFKFCNFMCVFLTIITIFSFCSVNILADNSYSLTEPTQIIYDEIDLLTDSEEQKLEQMAKENKLFNSVFFISDRDVKNYSENTVVFYLNMSTRDTGVDIMDSDYDFDKLLDYGSYAYENNVHFASDGDYYEYFEHCFNDVQKCYEKGKVPTTFKLNFNFKTLLSIVVISAIIIVLMFLQHNKANKNISNVVYLKNNDVVVNNRNDAYIGSRTTVQHDYYKSNNSGGSSGGHSGRSSSGSARSGGRF